ncbi:MAG: hypothetical protein HOQ05_06450 [Corynebacteriales bacterium]|nr:hypothetical protein [Mycobacteriales bacterium]
MRRWLKNNALSVTVFSAFLIFLILQAIFGWHASNAELTEHGQPTDSFPSYLTSGEFFEAVFENWESEFLQMGFYVLLTAYLIQRGSAESKKETGQEEPTQTRSFGRLIYENSLVIALLSIFVLSFILHLLGGTAAYNEEQVEHGSSKVSVIEFLGNPEFWFQSMQNWQSEFLAVGALIVLSIFLRQKGSPQSKKVDDPNSKTGV